MEEAAIRPHKSQYWLNPRIDDPEEHASRVARVCDVYHQARALEAVGIHVVSCDEKTSIQALERAASTRPTRPGRDERREFEYKRHGTLCLIANLVVATGKILAPTLGPTRDEQDFARHIEQTIATDAEAGWIFVADNLTTHCSEALVRLVAAHENMEAELGRKGVSAGCTTRPGRPSAAHAGCGQSCAAACPGGGMLLSGILFDVASRRRFLSDESHRIRFVYTPKHCSWLNQIEIWFGILVRRALSRASFRSTDELGAAIREFIEYFNEVLAKPFRWTYTGRPLAA